MALPPGATVRRLVVGGVELHAFDTAMKIYDHGDCPRIAISGIYGGQVVRPFNTILYRMQEYGFRPLDKRNFEPSLKAFLE